MAAKTYVAVDVEKKGDGPAFPVIQIGVAWGTNLKDIKTRSFCFDYHSGDRKVEFQKRCFDEFWTEHLDILARIEKEAIEPTAQWRAFIEFWDKFDENVVIVSDNPAYDIEAIDFHVWEEAKRFPIRWTADGKYRKVCDPGQQMKGLLKGTQNAIRRRADKVAPHDHWAENDAKNILAQYFITRNMIPSAVDVWTVATALVGIGAAIGFVLGRRKN